MSSEQELVSDALRESEEEVRQLEFLLEQTTSELLESRKTVSLLNNMCTISSFLSNEALVPRGSPVNEHAEFDFQTQSNSSKSMLWSCLCAACFSGAFLFLLKAHWFAHMGGHWAPIFLRYLQDWFAQRGPLMDAGLQSTLSALSHFAFLLPVLPFFPPLYAAFQKKSFNGIFTLAFSLVGAAAALLISEGTDSFSKISIRSLFFSQLSLLASALGAHLELTTSLSSLAMESEDMRLLKRLGFWNAAEAGLWGWQGTLRRTLQGVFTVFLFLVNIVAASASLALSISIGLPTTVRDDASGPLAAASTAALKVIGKFHPNTLPPLSTFLAAWWTVHSLFELIFSFRRVQAARRARARLIFFLERINIAIRGADTALTRITRMLMSIGGEERQGVLKGRGAATMLLISYMASLTPSIRSFMGWGGEGAKKDGGSISFATWLSAGGEESLHPDSLFLAVVIPKLVVFLWDH